MLLIFSACRVSLSVYLLEKMSAHTDIDDIAAATGV
jgi:hypothetical protein